MRRMSHNSNQVFLKTTESSVEYWILIATFLHNLNTQNSIFHRWVDRQLIPSLNWPYLILILSYLTYFMIRRVTCVFPNRDFACFLCFETVWSWNSLIPIGTDAMSRNTWNNWHNFIVDQYTVLNYIFV